MDWGNLNQSRAGKAIVVGLVVLTALVTWTAMSRHRYAVQMSTPLPGEGSGDTCAVWFIGSSTIYRWDNLTTDMAPWKVVKRGMNGANFEQLIPRFSHDPARVPPRAIVLYAGENDLANGATVEQTLGQLQTFLTLKTRMFGATGVVLVSVKPSPTRWSIRPEQLRYNTAMRQLADARADLDYVEIGPLLMAGDKPGNFYVEDGVHLRPEGYRLWVPGLNAALGQRLGKPECPAPKP